MNDTARAAVTADELNRLGHEALRGGFVADARAYFETAVCQDPFNAKAWSNLGVALSAVKLRPAALVAFRRAVQIEPADVIFRKNLGHELFMMGEFSAAEGEYDRAFGCTLRSTNVDLVPLLNNRGLNYIALEYWRDAIQDLKMARDEAADAGRAQEAASAEFDLAHATLASDDFENGFRLFESRWASLDKLPAQSLPAKDWIGQSLWPPGTGGKSILVFHEQGYGDTLQFMRLLFPLRARAGRVIVAVPKALVRLLSLNLPGIETIDQDGPLPITDYKIAMASLARFLMPSNLSELWCGPYIDEPFVEPKPPLARAQFAIGICWAGGHSGTDTDAARSTEIDYFLRLAEIPGVSLHSLQVGGREKDIYTRGASVLVEDLAPRMFDFAETALVIDALDLVVTVDTAVAHLAAAMGKPTFILSRYVGCWRWMGRDKETSPWYPSVRLFHQRRVGDWHEVMTRVVEAVAAFKDMKPGDRWVDQKGRALPIPEFERRLR